MTLPAAETSWLWVTTQALAQPGEDVTVQALHVDADEDFATDTLTLDLESAPLIWPDVDEQSRLLSANVTVSNEALSLNLLRDDDVLSATSDSVGYLVAPRPRLVRSLPRPSARPLGEDT
jgi:hypothetical protein